MSQFEYEARRVSSQKTQKVLESAVIAAYDAIKWLVNFIAHMIKVALGK